MEKWRLDRLLKAVDAGVDSGPAYTWASRFRLMSSERSSMRCLAGGAEQPGI